MIDANGDGTTTLGYDELDRLTSIDYSGSDTPDTTYTYDALGHRTQMTDGSGTIDYTYDYTDEERLHTATSNSQTTTYGYDPAGNLTSTEYPSGNGYTETDTYDKA